MIGCTKLHRAFPALLGAVAVSLAACADAPTAVPAETPALSKAGSAPNQPVRLTFDKCPADPENPLGGVWVGEVAGDIEGDLRTELRDVRIAGPIWHVRFDWIIDAGDDSFTADLSGTLNTSTGRVVMGGRVAEGFLEGARVHEEGQRTDDPEPLCFSGIIRIMPATAR